ncbi:unnamed protein product [Colias eurytheme]|nr:unnamed protein product [Colias eurytheme]
MSERSTNQATQVRESLELTYQKEEINPANVSLVFNKEDNLKTRNKEDLVKSGPSFLDDNYVSDWMIVYGRKKSNSYVQDNGNGKRNSKSSNFESERDDLKKWVENLIINIVKEAMTFK